MRGPCAVYSCKNKGTHSFPRDERLRVQWVKSLRLDIKRMRGGQFKKYLYVCSDHFKPTDLITRPLLFDGDQETKRLRKNSVPSIFPWTDKPYNTTDSEEYSVKIDPTLASFDYSRTEPAIAFVEEIPFVAMEPTTPNEDPLEYNESDNDVESSTDILFHNDDVQSSMDKISHMQFDDDDLSVSLDIEVNTWQDDTEESTYEVAVQTNCNCNCNCNSTSRNSPILYDDEKQGFNSHTYKHRNKVIHFYTGLESYVKVLFVFHSLGECVHNLKYIYGPPPKKLDPFEQLFITLIILRQHKTFEEISMMYLITIKQVSNIFITWVRLMSLQWRNLDLWVNKSTVKAYMPLDFHDKYPMTRAVIDATECPIKKPGLPKAQQITFSTYKNKNTVKVLIGISPGGLITYVSPAYGGSASDRQIIERSDILHKFENNDEIMVDKGLNVQDIFISYGVKVNMPSFFKKGNQINPDTLRETRKVASKRVHVERVIGLMKTYKILTLPMNRIETLLSSDIIFICAMLVNFRTNIINKSA